MAYTTVRILITGIDNKGRGLYVQYRGVIIIGERGIIKFKLHVFGC